MDVKVITRHTPSNYGSLLQTIAMQIVVEKLGHNCETIDYCRTDEMGLQQVLTNLRQKPRWNKIFLKKIAYVVFRYPEEKIQQVKFERLRKKYLKLTSKCHLHEDLCSIKSDIFVTGSDQVWGPMMNGRFDPVYFLSFVSDNVRKIAYAASFGKTSFTEDIQVEYKKLLSRYDAISVRENSAREILDEWSIPNKGQVLDPTLLLNAKQWSSFIRKEIEERYVLVYQLHNNPILSDYAKRFSEKVGLPLYRISPSFHQILRKGKFIYLPDLGDFLSYIKNAEYMLTDSFHGTAFAINFNVQFVEILPNNNTGSRNMSILKLTGLTDRILADDSDFSFVDEKKINYKLVNEKIEKERSKSINILKDEISI